jgi:predicted MPP superfamily phosphohydrolase
MTALLQISDTHFGTERPAVVAALLRLVREHSPSLVVFSGDITQRATRSQFDAARRFADAMGTVPSIAIPGNHDIPLFDVATRVLNPYGRYRRAFGEELEPVHESEHWLVVALNTTRPYRHKDGEVSPAQVERVARRLAHATPAQLRIVVTHQPVGVTRPEDETNLLHGHERAVHRWAQAGADLVLGGHIHLPFIVPMHERRPELARPLWVVQAGTALSTRLRHEAGNSVNLVRRLHVPDEEGARRCVVERWDYAEGKGEFEQVRVHKLVLGSHANAIDL